MSKYDWTAPGNSLEQSVADGRFASEADDFDPLIARLSAAAQVKAALAELVAAALNGTAGNVRRGAGSPEGVVTADRGVIYEQTDGTGGTVLWVKLTDGTNTGWVDLDLSAITNLLDGTGSPEAVVTAAVGTLYLQTDGTGGLAVWFKNSGSGTTGWLNLQADTNVKNVVSFGAKGDGSTNDDAAITAAIAAAPANGVILFPSTANYYRITSAISVTKALTFLGPAEVRQVTANTAGFTVAGGINNVRFVDLTITGDGAYNVATTASGDGIRVAGTSAAAPNTGIHILRCLIQNWTRACVQLEWCTDFRVEGNRLTNASNSGLTTLSCLRGTVTDNEVDTIGNATDTYGIIHTRRDNDSVVTHPRATDITTDNNRVRGVSAWEGIDTHGGERCPITNNLITGCFIAIAVADARNGAGTATFGAIDIDIEGNTCASGVTNGSYGAGIVFAGAGAAARATGRVSNNIITGYGDEDAATSGAIVVTNARVDVVNNLLSQPSPHGVLFFTETDDSVAQGNTVIDPWSNSVTVASAVRVNDASGVIEVTNNRLIRGTKSATYTGVHGCSTTGAGITLAAWGNDFTDATTSAYGDGSTTTKRFLEVYGRLKAHNFDLPTRTVSAATDTPTVADFQILCNAASNSITINLPAVATAARMFLFLKRSDGSSTNSVTIDADGSELIDGQTTVSLPTQHQGVLLYCDGSQWRTLGESALGDVQDFTTQTTTYSIAQNIRLVLADATGGAFTVTVPAASVNRGRRFTVLKTDSTSAAITLARSGSNTLNGATSLLLNHQYQSVTLESDGTNYFVVGAAYITRQAIDGWYQDNVTASQTDVELTRAQGRWYALRAGSLTGISVKATEARTAGTLTVEVYANTGLAGAAGSQLGSLAAVLDGTNTSFKATFQGRGTSTFAAGTELYAVVTTDGSWLPTTSDIRVALEVET